MSDLPNGWERTTLRELGIEAKGGFPSGRHNKTGEGIPHLRPMNVDRLGRIDLSEVKYVAPDKDVRLAVGDVLFNNTNSPPLVGKTAYFDKPGEFAFSNHMTRLRTSDGIDPKFLAAQLHTLWGRGLFRTLCTKHVNQASVSTQPLLDVEIAVPPLAEQRRIVAAIEEQFSRLDASQQDLRQVAQRLDTLWRAAIDAAVGGDWSQVRLGDVTALQSYGSSAKARRDPPGVPVLRMGNIQPGRIDFTDLKYFPPNHPDPERFLLAEGDLLFNRTNSPELVGKTAVFRGDGTPTSFASYLIRVRLTEDCLPEWAAFLINSTLGRRYIASVRSQQVGQANVNGTKLAAMPIPLPPLDEQRRIVADLEQQLSLVESLRASVDATRKRSAALRRAILERAFCGELVPQDPDDEPASVLLERVRAERAASPKPKRRKRVTA